MSVVRILRLVGNALMLLPIVLALAALMVAFYLRCGRLEPIIGGVTIGTAVLLVIGFGSWLTEAGK